MPDVFDQVDLSSKASTPDVFDHAAGQGTYNPAPAGQVNNALAAARQQHGQLVTGQQQAATQQAAQAAEVANQSGFANFANAAYQRGIVPLSNLASRIHGAFGGTAMQPEVMEGPQAEEYQAKRAALEAGVQPEIQQTQQFANTVAPYDPNRLSGKIGAVAGPTGVALLGGGMTPEIMALQGGENAQENVEAVRAAGGNISEGQAAANVLGNAAMGYGFGQFAPGGAASESILGQLPQVASPLAATALRAGVQAPVSALEMGGMQTGGNALNIATNTETPEQQKQSNAQRLFSGVPEAMATGGILGGLASPFHGSAKGDVFDKAVPSEVNRPTEEVAEVPQLRKSIADLNDRLTKAQDETHPDNVLAKIRQEASGAAAKAAEPAPALAEGEHHFLSPEQRTVAEGESGGFAHDLAMKQLNERLAPGLQEQERRIPGSPGATPEDEQRFAETTKAGVHFATPEEVNPKGIEALNAFQKSSGEQAVREEFGEPKPVEATPPVPMDDPNRLSQLASGKLHELIHSEEGGERLSAADILGPGSIIHEEVKPVIRRAVDTFKGGIDALRSVFPVETKSASPEATGAFRANLAEGRLNTQQVEDRITQARKPFTDLSPDENLDIIRNAYNVTPQPSPELQAVTDSIYKDNNQGREQLAALGHDAAEGWEEQHLNMLWKKDDAAAAKLNTKVARPGKVEGPASFLKTRAEGDFDSKLAKGLVPAFDNIFDMHLATTVERNRYIAGVKAMGDLVDTQSIEYRPTTAKGKIPEGWSETPRETHGPLRGLLKDKIGAEQGGTFIAPDPVNRILRNQVTPSLFATGFRGDIKNALQAYNNTATQALLGLSAYHITKVAKENFVLQTARALELSIKGDSQEAAEAKARAVDPVGLIARGKRVQDTLLHPETATPEEATRNAAMIQSGMSAKSDTSYENKIRDRFSKALKDGGIQGVVRAAAWSPLALNETISQNGVFKYVQHAKLSIGADMMSDYLRNNPGATTSDIRLHGGRISDHLDNVLGLMERDNLFWNKTARDIATLSTLSVGWNYGSGRQAVGGLVDLGAGLHGLTKGGKVSDIATNRVTYLATMAATSAIIGSMATYINTGAAPASLKDYIFPKSGNKDREGHDVRYNPGLYTSDYYDFLTHPLSTLAAKASPLVHAATDLLTNRDYKNNPVYDSTDPGDTFHHRMAGDIAKYLLKANIPMGIQQAVNTYQGGGSSSASPTEQALPWLGVKHAPVSQSESPAELAARDIVSNAPHQGSETPEHADAMRRLANLTRDKDPDAQDQIGKAVTAGTITRKDVGTIHKRASEPGGLQGLLGNSEMDARSLMRKVFPTMGQDEVKANQFLIRRKINGANIPVEEKQEYLGKLNDAVKGE